MVTSIELYSAGGPSSGVVISELGSGEFSYIGFFGPSGFGDGILVGQPQNYTWITSADSITSPGGDIRASGELTNNEWVDASGVSMSGASRLNLVQVKESGNATIMIRVVDTGSVINVQNARLYAYDGVDVNNDPSGVWVFTREIIPPSYPGSGDTQWTLTDAENYNYLVDRTDFVDYSASNVFDYFIGISIRPKLSAASGTTRFAFYFICDIV